MLYQNELSSSSPILLAIGNPIYKLTKFLVPVLSNITQNEFTVKDSFIFVDEILTQDSDLCMARFFHLFWWNFNSILWSLYG